MVFLLCILYSVACNTQILKCLAFQDTVGVVVMNAKWRNDTFYLKTVKSCLIGHIWFGVSGEFTKERQKDSVLV